MAPTSKIHNNFSATHTLKSSERRNDPEFSRPRTCNRARARMRTHHLQVHILSKIQDCYIFVWQLVCELISNQQSGLPSGSGRHRDPRVCRASPNSKKKLRARMCGACALRLILIRGLIHVSDHLMSYTNNSKELFCNSHTQKFRTTLRS